MNLDMPLGSRCVQESRIVVNSQYSDRDLLLLHGWSKQKIKQKFESAMAYTKYRDYRTYAQALCTTHIKGHKRVCKHTPHTNADTELYAPKQLISNVSSRGIKNRENITKGHVIGRKCQKTDTLSVHSCPDLIVDNHTDNNEVRQVYNIPVVNRFHTLQADEGVQVSTDTITKEQLSVPQVVCSGTRLQDQVAKVPDVPLDLQVMDTSYTSVSNSSQTYPDPDSTQSDVTAMVPELLPEYQKCKAQIGTKFGCVPLAPSYVYKGQSQVWESVPDVLTAHKLIRDSGLPNFLGLRIPVETNLNVSSWRKHLVDYFDQQLPDLIELGFPLDFDRTRDLQSTLVNHASARLYPDHVDRYIQEEVGFKAMLGPLDIKPFDIHISPFMTRDKSDSNSRRTIMDLSFPKGLSVNDGVLNNTTKFSMHYPSVDTII